MLLKVVSAQGCKKHYCCGGAVVVLLRIMKHMKPTSIDITSHLLSIPLSIQLYSSLYSCRQGFGFIDMAGQTLFVHFSECEVGKQPKEGDILTFEYEPRNPAESLGGTGGPSVDISKTIPFNILQHPSTFNLVILI